MSANKKETGRNLKKKWLDIVRVPTFVITGTSFKRKCCVTGRTRFTFPYNIIDGLVATAYIYSACTGTKQSIQY